ncbi:hypothetical protein ILYODFUR_009195 [Ilyodon furcidens]|uniref:Uncharacterized protein n=1 Tax=Ilyodon furcidens TaxID=33524 RepID=A0ABV0U3X0_9TELE
MIRQMEKDYDTVVISFTAVHPLPRQVSTALLQSSPRQVHRALLQSSPHQVHRALLQSSPRQVHSQVYSLTHLSLTHISQTHLSLTPGQTHHMCLPHQKFFLN